MNIKEIITSPFKLGVNATYGIYDFFLSYHKAQKISKTNKVLVDYYDESDIQRDYTGLLNEEKSLVLIEGIKAIRIVTKIFHSEIGLQPIILVYAKSHLTIDFKNIHPNLKKITYSLDNEQPLTNDLLIFFDKLKLKDLGITINLEQFKTINEPARDWTKDSRMIMDKEFFKIGANIPNERIIAVAIISLLFGSIGGSMVMLIIIVALRLLGVL